jgi:hypothetical protein
MAAHDPVERVLSIRGMRTRLVSRKGRRVCGRSPTPFSFHLEREGLRRPFRLRYSCLISLVRSPKARRYGTQKLDLGSLQGGYVFLQRGLGFPLIGNSHVIWTFVKAITGIGPYRLIGDLEGPSKRVLALTAVFDHDRIMRQKAACSLSENRAADQSPQ